MNKFILAENPFHPEQSGCYIISLIDPIAIIQCHEGHIEFKPGKYYAHYQFRNIDDQIEEWTLSLYHFFTTEFDSEKHGAMVEHLFKRAWRWYRSYLEWEDHQTN